MSRRSTLICAVLLSSLGAPITGSARAQQTAPTTVTILRRTAVRVAPEPGASTIAFVNPATFEVTRWQVKSGFVRLLLAEIDRRRPTGGYGYLDTAAVAIDSAVTTAAVRVRRDTVVPARPAAQAPAPSRPAPPAVVATPSAPNAAASSAAAPVRTATDSVAPLARFLVGAWTCRGGTPAGRTLSSDVRFGAVLGDRWLEVAHLDVPPGRYSSLALWPLAPADSAPLTTVVYDNFGGARRFLLDGWKSDSVVLVRDTTERGARGERFTYRRVSPNSYWYAWHVRRAASGPEVLGDSATCTRR
jgi:hypothetical protein